MPLPELPELEELYRLYRADLYRYLCHLTHDPAEAEDLLSETFLRALKRLHTYRGDCAVKTWLFGIARNIWLEGLRKKHPTASTDDLLEGCLAEDTLTERTDSRLQWQRVKELLQKGMTEPAAWCSCGPWATATMKLPRSCRSAKARPA